MRGARALSRYRVNISCSVRGAKSSLSTASTYFIDIFYIFSYFSANESFAHVKPPYPPFHNIKSYFSDFYFLRENIEKTMWSYRHLMVMLGEGRQSSLSLSRQHIMLGEGRQICSLHRVYIFYRYFLHIFVNFSANESFAHVFIDNHTKCKSYFSDF